MKTLVTLLLLGMSLLARAEIVEIGNEELRKLVAQGVKLVDLRTAGEWQQTGVLAGSHMITLFNERGQANPDWKKEVNAVAPADQPLVLICRSGNRSGVAAKMLNEASPSRRIYNVREGMNGWARAGQPVVSFQQNQKTAGIRCAPVC